MKPPPSGANIARVFSPGRINLIGEHTDYNMGYVLPAAIDLGLHLKMRRSANPYRCNLQSDRMEKDLSFDLRQLPETGEGWEKYVLGLLHRLQERGSPIEGFDCDIESTLPVGAGLSSSAALSCGLLLGLNELFALGMERLQIARLAQETENAFADLQCGIMDPFASLMGKEDHFLQLDCQSLEFKYISSILTPFSLVLLDSGVKHELASSAYNERREECAKGVELLKKRFAGLGNLRDLSAEQWKEASPDLPEPVRSRCRHVLEENDRVLQASRALKSGDVASLGKLLYASHESLSKDYEVSCPELDFLVSVSSTYQGVAGARMMGGGFGGCTLNLVRDESLPDFVAGMKKQYKKSFSRELRDIRVNVSDGGRLL